MNKKFIAIVMSCIMLLSTAISAVALPPPGPSLTKTLKIERAATFVADGKPFGDFWGLSKDAGNMTVVAGVGPNGEAAAHFTGSGLDYFLPDPINNFVGCEEISLDIKSTKDFTFSFDLDFKKSGIVKSTSAYNIASTNGQWKTVVIPMSVFGDGEVSLADVYNMKTNFAETDFEPAIRFIASSEDAYVTNYKLRGYQTGTAMSVVKTITEDYTNGKSRTMLGTWSGTPISFDPAVEKPTYVPEFAFASGFSEDGTKNALYIGGVPDDKNRRVSTNGVKNTYTYAGGNLIAPDDLVGFDIIRVKYASNKTVSLFMYQKDEVTKFPNGKNEIQSAGVSLPSTKSGADITKKDDRVWQTIDIPVESFINDNPKNEWVRNMKGGNNGKSGSEFKFTPANCYRFEGMKYGVDPENDGTCRRDEGIVIESIEALWITKLPTVKTLKLSTEGGNDESNIAVGNNKLTATFASESTEPSQGTVFVAAMYKNDSENSLPPKLLGLDLITVDVPAGGVESEPYSLNLATPPDINDDNSWEVYIRFMVWKDIKTMDQLTQVGTITLFETKYE